MAVPEENPRPSVVDAEYKIIHGPWPRWVLHLSLFKLAATAAAVVAVCVVLTLAVLVGLGVFR
ncbi:hypothetical protein DJ021_15165 [Phenylobacterium hankyongense]|uniref:Uncharacterized protein n=1 Tax=Phenylobacterium hankyongense TaxID=1813876 RepID=A0A328B3D9_9CAUL|nr:hypothetical protein [Phenylobacterium hankyongense]RAK61055.1 hypothetical protein DJ021_15165 [Phenylobacterium hankyongense]